MERKDHSKQNFLKEKKQLQEKHDALSKRLSNQGFLNRAQPDIIEETRLQRTQLEESIQALNTLIQS